VEGKFLVVTSAVMLCACKLTPQGLSPSAHLGDGQVQKDFYDKPLLPFITKMIITFVDGFNIGSQNVTHKLLPVPLPHRIHE
jgi:hypothetical protein